MELDWIEGNPDPNEKSIIPDLFIKRPDGFYDIVDFKTAEPDQENLTTGQRKRRRFKQHPVNEGLAQLANYRDYFKFDKNSKYAESNYGIRVQNPNLKLIVGSYENLPNQELDEAMRIFNGDKDISVINYEALAFSYLNSTNNLKIKQEQ